MERPNPPAPRGLLLAALCALPVLAAGDQMRGPMQVHAAVLPRTEVEVRAPATLTVTRSDLARGRVDSAAGVEIRAYSNTSQGLEVQLDAPPGLFKALHVRGPGIAAVLPGEGGAVAWRWTGKPGFREPAALRLTLGFELAVGATAGEIAWPVQITGRALAQ